jgi:RND superfamily putative drug exporter
MATYLYRLGRFAFRRRRLVLLVWLGLLAVGIAGAAALSGPTSNGFSIPGTESQRAADLLDERFPQAGADAATARVVFQAPPGQRLTDAANTAQVQQTLGRITDAPQVARVLDPFTAKAISPDGRTGYAQVTRPRQPWPPPSNRPARPGSRSSTAVTPCRCRTSRARPR